MTDAVEILYRQYYNTPQARARAEKTRREMRGNAIYRLQRRVAGLKLKLAEAEEELAWWENAKLKVPDESA